MLSHLSSSTCVDIPGTDYRVATIAGPPESCHRAKKMVEDIVAEVSTYSKIYSVQLQYVLALSALHHLMNNIVLSTVFECIHKQHYYKHSSLPWGWTLHVESMNGGSKPHTDQSAFYDSVH